MTEEQKTQFRKKFIKDFSNAIADEYSGIDTISRAYIELTISQCMDSAIMHREKLDLGIDDGYDLTP